jgi:hypothetical protein
MKDGKAEPFNGEYNVQNYENRARAWITAMMLVPTVGSFPKDTNGNPTIGYKRVSRKQSMK